MMMCLHHGGFLIDATWAIGEGDTKVRWSGQEETSLHDRPWCPPDPTAHDRAQRYRAMAECLDSVIVNHKRGNDAGSPQARVEASGNRIDSFECAQHAVDEGGGN